MSSGSEVLSRPGHYPQRSERLYGRGTITWRGTTFQNVKLGDGCRYNFVATRDGVTAELCTATKGVADLKIGKDTFECQMRR